MEPDIFRHAIKILEERKEEFETEIKFVNDEMETLKSTYIRENSEFKIDDVVYYKVDNKYYNILSVNINKDGEFIYDIDMNKVTQYIDVKGDLLRKVNNEKRQSYTVIE